MLVPNIISRHLSLSRVAKRTGFAASGFGFRWSCACSNIPAYLEKDKLSVQSKVNNQFQVRNPNINHNKTTWNGLKYIGLKYQKYQSPPMVHKFLLRKISAPGMVFALEFLKVCVWWKCARIVFRGPGSYLNLIESRWIWYIWPALHSSPSTLCTPFNASSCQPKMSQDLSCTSQCLRRESKYRLYFIRDLLMVLQTIKFPALRRRTTRHTLPTKSSSLQHAQPGLSKMFNYIKVMVTKKNIHPLSKFYCSTDMEQRGFKIFCPSCVAK